MKAIVSFLVVAGALVSTAVPASEELAKSKGCLTCHAMDAKILGPSYKEVAKKYAGQADAETKLADKVIKGGSGVWGNIPMPPNARVTPEEAKTLVHWILNLK
ncbi:MAG TPA: c-type cytochrome [Methylococcaceae bacterium]|nr:c-type cytochrome [Methylococcaceae bacterium]